MPTLQFWRVTVKRGRKPHLLPFVPGEGTGVIALCGKMLPEDSRTRGAASTVSQPRGDECELCRLRSGYYKKPKPTAEEKIEIDRYKAWNEVLKLLDRLRLTKEQQRDFVEKVVQASQ